MHTIKHIRKMRTTIDISDELIEEAMEILKTSTKKETIEKALTEMISQYKRKQIIMYRGKVDLDINLDTLRKEMQDYAVKKYTWGYISNEYGKLFKGTV